MPASENIFKKRLKAGETLMGCWLSGASPVMTEILTTAGFDWLLIDGEHSPNTITTMTEQMRIIEPSGVPALARVPNGDVWQIKMVLDTGCQTVLVPMIESADQAREMVQAMKYPPEGIRGVGAYAARASGYGGTPQYLETANEQTCLLLQIENKAGLQALDEVLTIDGVDGVFIGPSDLSANLGYLGQPEHPDVQEAIDTALGKILASDKAAGILTMNLDLVKKYKSMGVGFIAAAMDIPMLATTARARAKTLAEIE
ncbi:MAG: HpcH/HpaI aldolase/citrate lyase family protein [Pseudomonadota bacterium]